MAATLQHTINRSPWRPWLAALPVLLVLGAVVPGLFSMVQHAFDAAVWQALFNDAQWPKALQITLLSSVLSTLLACILAGAVAMVHYPSVAWKKWQSRLPLLLALPHVGFAIGLFFLLAPSGWLARAIAPLSGWSYPPDWQSVQDPWGLSLALGLAIKESWFLLWMLVAVLGEKEVSRQLVLGRTLGYNRWQVWLHILWPQLLPRLQWPVLAVFAYSLSVVDMALVLGPGNPPTLAVLAWHWLIDPDAALQARGSAASLVLVALLLLFMLLAKLLTTLLQLPWRYPKGNRRVAASKMLQGMARLPLFINAVLVGYAVCMVLVLWSLAETWFFPAFMPQAFILQHWQDANLAPFYTTLWLALASSLLALPMVLLWLEWGPKQLPMLMYLPLIFPALPLVTGQYATLLHLQLDGTATALVWSHLLWVLPYMALTLTGPYQAFDQRVVLAARALGCSPLGACLRVKWPLLLRPLLFSLAVGFSVSVVQYLPTLFAGAGRYATVTTEAVALSAGGNRSIMAVQALLQIMLPMAALSLAGLLAYGWAQHRQGVR